MSIEELLKPRYKVIADYPDNPYSVGEIIKLEQNGYESDLNKFIKKFCDKCPHLFKKLEWWEERKESEMPEYVKSLSGAIWKIKQWDNPRNIAVEKDGHWLFYDDILPATEEEYIQYQQNKKQ